MRRPAFHHDLMTLRDELFHDLGHERDPPLTRDRFLRDTDPHKSGGPYMSRGSQRRLISPVRTCHTGRPRRPPPHHSLEGRLMVRDGPSVVPRWRWWRSNSGRACGSVWRPAGGGRACVKTWWIPSGLKPMVLQLRPSKQPPLQGYHRASADGGSTSTRKVRTATPSAKARWYLGIGSRLLG